VLASAVQKGAQAAVTFSGSTLVVESLVRCKIGGARVLPSLTKRAQPESPWGWCRVVPSPLDRCFPASMEAWGSYLEVDAEANVELYREMLGK